MTKLLDEAVAAARNLPAAMQDDVARVIMALTGGEPPFVRPSPEEAASFDESFAEAERGEFATDEQIRALLGEVFYQASAAEIIVHGVRHGAREPRSMPM